MFKLVVARSVTDPQKIRNMRMQAGLEHIPTDMQGL